MYVYVYICSISTSSVSKRNIIIPHNNMIMIQRCQKSNGKTHSTIPPELASSADHNSGKVMATNGTGGQKPNMPRVWYTCSLHNNVYGRAVFYSATITIQRTQAATTLNAYRSNRTISLRAVWILFVCSSH